jgi:hypothetical protein
VPELEHSGLDLSKHGKCSRDISLDGHACGSPEIRPAAFQPQARFSDDDFLAGAGPGSSRDPETHR